ncbi:MAG: hypothetical protein HQL52_10730 [Magnetococcales bacterium]|nr:hypothetical protein [Magnetococcales bacterium]
MTSNIREIASALRKLPWKSFDDLPPPKRKICFFTNGSDIWGGWINRRDQPVGFPLHLPLESAKPIYPTHWLELPPPSEKKSSHASGEDSIFGSQGNLRFKKYRGMT